MSMMCWHKLCLQARPQHCCKQKCHGRPAGEVSACCELMAGCQRILSSFDKSLLLSTGCWCGRATTMACR